ncbi:hypothetical protein WA577_003865, partial [Blastocystis sp. JDR]
SELTPNALRNALSESSIQNVVVQVTNIKTSNSDTSSTKRHVLIISDGTTAVRALTTTQQSGLIDSGTITNNTIIRIISSKTVKSSAILLTNIEVVKQCNYMIGNPTVMMTPTSAAPKPQAAQPQFNQPMQPAQPPMQQPAYHPSVQPAQPSYQQPS